MAQFYADIQGNRGMATRMGTKKSGMSAHIRGWHVGVSVRIWHEDGKDVIQVTETGGSSNPSGKGVVAFIREK